MRNQTALITVLSVRLRTGKSIKYGTKRKSDFMQSAKSMSNPIELKAAKERLERKKYAAQVLSVFDRLTHAERRQLQERRIVVERKARGQL